VFGVTMISVTLIIAFLADDNGGSKMVHNAECYCVQMTLFDDVLGVTMEGQ
jgi:hypothetical protein